jgi:hypothetical protein
VGEKNMRNVTCCVLAAALATAPAFAQNAPATENAVEANAANATLPADNAGAANDVAAVPEAAPVAEPMATPAPEPPKRSGGFPWGVLGLLGLLGFMGRKRRD